MKTCSIQSCPNKHLSKGFCMKHYYRYKRGQSILGKSRFDRRPAIISDGLVKIELGNKRGYTFVDLEDTYVDKYNWSLDGHGYPCSYIDGRIVKLHQMIIGKSPSGFVIDHIDRDKLNNHRSNLRHVTQKENMFNSTISDNWNLQKGIRQCQD